MILKRETAYPVIAANDELNEGVHNVSRLIDTLDVLDDNSPAADQLVLLLVIPSILLLSFGLRWRYRIVQSVRKIIMIDQTCFTYCTC